MLSSSTLTRRIGYTLGRMRLLNPQAPTWQERISLALIQFTFFCADISNTDCWPFHPCWQCCSCTRLLRRTRQSVPPQNVLWMPPTRWGATRFPLPAELCGLFPLVELAETGGSGRFPRCTAPPTMREQSCYCSSSRSKWIFYSYWFCKILHFWTFSKHKLLQCSCA